MSFFSSRIRFFALFLVFFGLCSHGEALTYYVSSERGRDDYPGGKGAPFNTLSRALRQYRVLCRARMLPDGGVTIVLEAGRHRLESGLVLGAAESAGADRPLLIAGEDGAVLHGGVELEHGAFQVVTDEAVLRRLPKVARGKVMSYDLSKVGVGACGVSPDVFRGGMACGELYVGGVAQRLARWPNEGWAALGNVIDRGERSVNGQGGRGGIFEYTAGTPAKSWDVSKGVWLHGFWSHDWYDEVIRVSGIDPIKKRIYLKSQGSTYGIGPSQGWNRQPRRYAALNVLEELDMPGEWCLEAGSTTLYVWLPEGAAQSRIVYSTLSEPMVALNGCSNIQFRGLTFECSRGGGLVLSGNGNRVMGCTFRNLGGEGIVVKGYGNVVSGCDLHGLGGSGVVVVGGDAKSLTRGDNVVENCHIHHIGRFKRAYSGAVHVSGVGNIVRNNLLHDLPHTAIFYGGNEQLIELNDIFGACLETGDAGALYTGRSWASQGNVVRHNYIHHIGGVDGWSMGVYLDDCDSGDTIDGNVFHEVRRAVFIGGGRNNRVLNNVFVDCRPALHMDDRGVSRIKWKAGRGESWDLEAKLEAVNYRSDVWRNAYPHLVNILSDRPELPLHNEVRRNIIVGGTGFSMKDSLRSLLEEKSNWFMDGASDPGFADRDGGDLTLRSVETIREYIPGFEGIPFGEIGLYGDENRRHVPDSRALLLRSLAARAAMPVLKSSRRYAVVPGKPRRFAAVGTSSKIVADGVLGNDEWQGTEQAGRVTLDSVGESGGKNVAACVLRAHAGVAGLSFGVEVPCVSDSAPVASGAWGECDGVEIALRPIAGGSVFVYRGYPDGRWEVSDVSGIRPVERLMASQGVSFGAKVSSDGSSWRCEWTIPWSSLGIRHDAGKALGFNATVHRMGDDRWLTWCCNGEEFHDVDGGGVLVLP